MTGTAEVGESGEGSDPSTAAPVVDLLDPNGGKPRHFACFDGLRAIAAVSVLLLHTAWISGFTDRSSLGAYTSRLEIGVAVFFLISGFLLYRPFAVSHLSGSASPSIRRFWERRLLRIVPAYWLALTVLTYVFHLTTMGPGWQGVVIHYLFLQIYFPTQVFYGITQAWSLCTEMSFYLVLPLYAALVVYRRRSRNNQLVRELAGLVVLTLISYGFRYWALHLPLLTVKNGKFVAICTPNCGTKATFATLLVDWLPAYLDLFALGMLLAVISAWMSERETEPSWLRHPLMPWISWAGAALTFVAVSHVVTDHSILYFVTARVNIEKQTLYGIFAFLLLLPAVFGPQDRSLIRRLLRSWPLASLGVISYGIYLWHLPLIDGFLDWTGWQPHMEPFWILARGSLIFSIFFASISYFGLERPILRLKGRISWWDRGARSPAEEEVDSRDRPVIPCCGSDDRHVAVRVLPERIRDSRPRAAGERPEDGAPAFRRASSPISTSVSPQSRTTSCRNRSRPTCGALVDDVLKGSVGRRILDVDPEIAIPEIVASPHQVDGQHHQATEPSPGGDVGEKGSANLRRDMFDHADRVGTVEGGRSGSSSRVQFHERLASPASP